MRKIYLPPLNFQKLNFVLTPGDIMNNVFEVLVLLNAALLNRPSMDSMDFN